MAAVPLAVVDDLLARLDRALPGRVEGFYVVGSVSVGAFRLGRSDVDFVAILDRDLTAVELARLRVVHVGRWASSVVRDVGLGARWPLACNGIYLMCSDLARSPREVVPIAGHVAGRFRAASSAGFDVNPVTWHTLADHGLAIRGDPPEELQIHTDVQELRGWCLANLNSYWRRWARRRFETHALPRRAAAIGVLGAPRLHHTVATGSIVTKEDAAQYALETFDREWSALTKEALAFRRGGPTQPEYRYRPIRRRREASEFVAMVIDSANQLSLE